MSFNHDGTYICVCGQQFTNSQKFNSHKAHCKEHLTKKGNYDCVQQAYKDGAHKSRQKAIEKYEKSKQADADQWIAEKHICEKCGKVMTEKFGSGRFCCRSCANSHQRTDQSKQKNIQSLQERSESIGRLSKNNSLEHQIQYEQNPNHCQICNRILSYKKRNNKTCGNRQCVNTYLSMKLRHSYDNIGENILARHIVYKVVNDFDDTYYIGVRKCEDDNLDTYLGSGIRIKNKVKKYGAEHFHRVTLYEFHCSKDAYNKEVEILNSCLHDQRCLNLASGGKGGATFIGHHHTEETKSILRKKRAEWTITQEALDKISQKSQLYYQTHSNVNKGRIYVNNGKENKVIDPTALPDYLELGFIKGKLPRK